MSARRAIGLLVSVAALSGCGGADLPVPAPTAVTPARGSAGQATPIVIQGSGFSVLVVQSASGGAPAVNETFRAWLGEVPLQAVRRVDDTTLAATVPAGLPVGPGTLRVEGPYGTSGELASAFTVDAPPVGALAATISAAPATVTVGQSITVTLLVQNTGTAGLTGVAPGAPSVTGTGTTGTPAGPTPASLATLAPGASGSFTWTYPSTGAGALAFAGSAAGSSVPSGATVSAATAPTLPARVTVERPGALTASLPVSGAAAIGRDFTVSMTVANTGGAAVRNVVPGTPTLAPAGLAALKAGTGPVPPSVASLATGASTTFTWTFVAGTTPGTVRISAAASGSDANSGAAVTSATATSGEFTIGAAGIQATLAAARASTNVGQPLDLTLSLSNPGQAAVNGFTVSAPVVTSTDGATAPVIAGPTPPPPAVLSPGQSATITWTVDPAVGAGASTGNLSFRVTAAGVDAFSGASISAEPTAAVTVETPAEVTATGLAATPDTVVVGQPVSVTLGLGKTGAAAASVTAATLTGITCTTPPVLPVAATGPTTTLTWTGCATPSTPQTLSLGASATWVDLNVPLTPRTTNTVLTTVGVQAAAGIAVAFVAQPPSPVSAGQVLTLTARVANTAPAGGAVANGVTVAPTAANASGTADATCLAATPGATAIAAGNTQDYAFDCTVSGAGTLTFTASASGTAAGTGAPLIAEATTSPATTVLAAAGIAVAFVAQPPSPVSAGQVLTLTARVANTAPAGGAAANGVTVTPTFTTVTGDAAATCGAATPGATAIAAGTAQDYAFDCTVSGAGTLTFTASASGTAAGTGAPLVAEATTSPATTVLAAAGIAVAFVAQPPSPVSAGQVLTLTARVANTAPAGGAAANGVTVTPTFTTVTGDAAATCGAATPGATAIAAGTAQDYAFDCTVSGAGTLTFTASASGTAAGTAAPLAAEATTSPATTVQVPATVTAVSVAPSRATVSSGQLFDVTLALARTGTAPADITGASISGAGISCAVAPSPVTNIAVDQTLTWTGCTATTSGDLSASATWVDANLGGPAAPTNVVTAPLTVQAAAVVTAAGLVTVPAPVPVATTFSITLTLTRSGEAGATVSAASLTGPGVRCTPPPLPVVDIPASLNLTWTACDAFPNARQVPIEATATWVDQNDPGNPRTTDPATGTIDVQ